MDHTEKDISLFSLRHVKNEYPDWAQDALHIAYKKEDIDMANSACLRRQSNAIVEISVQHTVRMKRDQNASLPVESTIKQLLDNASVPNRYRDKEHPRHVSLAIGLPVALTVNIERRAGLCNGTRGVVFDFMQRPGFSIPIVLMKVTDKYRGPSFFQGIDNIVPICPRSLSWGSKVSEYRTERISLPLRLLYAMTVHKVQRLTCNKLVFDPTDCPTSAFAYVGLSRVRRREDIVLTHLLMPKSGLQQNRAREILSKESERMANLYNQCVHDTKALVMQMKKLAIIHNQEYNSR